jgi:ribosome-associated protein
MIPVTPSLALDEAEIEYQAIRAPGPGGQHVNKTESAIQLRFDARASASLPNAVFLRLKPLAGRRMTQDGVIVITANRHRSQEMNRRDALDRLVEMIRAAAVAPKRRRPTKPTFSSQKKRLERKKLHGARKKQRRAPDVN